jgi:integrase
MGKNLWVFSDLHGLERSVALSRAYLAHPQTHEELAALAETLPDFTATLRTVCDNTTRSYISVQQRYLAAAQVAGQTEFPPSTTFERDFWTGFAHELLPNGEKRKATTVYHAIYAVQRCFSDQGLLSPTRTPFHRALIRTITRDERRPIKQARPLVTTDAVRLVRYYDRESLASIRDCTMMAYMTSCGARSATTVGLCIGDLQFEKRGVVCTLRSLKGTRVPRLQAIPHSRRHLACFPCIAKEYVQRLAKTGIADGPLFRRIDRNGYIGSKALTTKAVTLLLRKGLAAAGVSEANSYSSHSFRHGVVQKAQELRWPRAEIQMLTGHMSEAGLAPYLLQADPWANAARSLLMDNEPRTKRRSVWDHE